MELFVIVSFSNLLRLDLPNLVPSFTAISERRLSGIATSPSVGGQALVFMMSVCSASVTCVRSISGEPTINVQNGK